MAIDLEMETGLALVLKLSVKIGLLIHKFASFSVANDISILTLRGRCAPLVICNSPIEEHQRKLRSGGPSNSEQPSPHTTSSGWRASSRLASQSAAYFSCNCFS